MTCLTLAKIAVNKMHNSVCPSIHPYSIPFLEDLWRDKKKKNRRVWDENKNLKMNICVYLKLE